MKQLSGRGLVRLNVQLMLMVAFALQFSSKCFAQTDAAKPATFQNPVLWEDLADLDVFRVGDVYYYSASNMHYSPGAPILRSYDLVHWEYAGHAIPVLDFSPAYNLDGGRAYVCSGIAS